MASAACALLEPIDLGGAIPDTPAQNVDLVRRVQRGDAAGMAELYEFISTGLRPYLARQLRAQDFHDKVHSIFVDVVIAIQRPIARASPLDGIRPHHRPAQSIRLHR